MSCKSVFECEIPGSPASAATISSPRDSATVPSGDPAPSQEDIRLTRQLADAGRLLDVPVHDHLIVGSGTTAYVSFAERGLL